MGLVRSDPAKFRLYLEFEVTKSWVQSLYMRMNYSQRVATTSRPIITLALWDELRIHFLHSIAVIVATYKIPDALIFNIDQTPSKFIATSKVTMAEKGSKHVAVAGSNDKRAITLT